MPVFSSHIILGPPVWSVAGAAARAQVVCEPEARPTRLRAALLAEGDAEQDSAHHEISRFRRADIDAGDPLAVLHGHHEYIFAADLLG